MLSLSSINRAQRGSERKDSDIEALASEAGGVNMVTIRGGESHSDIEPTTPTETRVTGGLPYEYDFHGLPAGQIGVQNGTMFKE